MRTRIQKPQHCLYALLACLSLDFASCETIEQPQSGLYFRIFHVGVPVGGALLLAGVLILIYTYFVRTGKARRLARINIEERSKLDAMMEYAKAYTFTIRDKETIEVSRRMKEIVESHSNYISIAHVLERTNEFYRDKFREFLQIETPGSHGIQIRAMLKPDVEQWFEVRLHISRVEGVVRKSGLIINIDANKEQEAVMLEAHRLMMLAKERESFISLMNHEIRTPLNAIVGFSSILSSMREGITEEEIAEYACIIRRNNTLLLNLIDTMMAITYLDNSDLRLHLQDYPLHTLVQEGIENAQPKIFGNTHPIVIDESPADLSIHCERRALWRILFHLLDNAVKFSYPDTPIHVGWKKTPHHVHLYVSNQGPAIPPKYKELLTRRFYKIDPFSQGAGLGLSLVKEYMARMMGKLLIDCEDDGTTRFTLRFPQIPQAKTALPAKPSPQVKTTRQPETI